ncbi:MAG: type II toxin-antitoxin system HicA family toxin [Patescibacteria group bacterium]|mgnify:CR=1
MSQLPILSGKDIIKVLERIGYHRGKQRGSHIRLTHSEFRSVTVPNYPSVSRGLLRKILRDAELSPAEFIKIVKQ